MTTWHERAAAMNLEARLVAQLEAMNDDEIADAFLESFDRRCVEWREANRLPSNPAEWKFAMFEVIRGLSGMEDFGRSDTWGPVIEPNGMVTLHRINTSTRGPSVR